MDVPSYPPSRGMHSSPAVRACLAGLVGLGLGVLTAYAQGWLPRELGSIANSSGSWALVAFGLAFFLASDVRGAAIIGSLALLGLLVGYVLGEHARGYSTGTNLVVFWGVVALVVGPLLGAAGHWVERRQVPLAAIGGGAMSGVLIGEGIYGLAFIAETTYTPYWWAELVAGAVLGIWVVARAPRDPRNAAIALVIAALTAVAFVVVYSRDLIAVLP